MILEIKKLLYDEKYTIAGAKKKLQRMRADREKQLQLQLPEKKFHDAIVRVRRELEDLRGLLT